jgi:peroxiredoxin
MLRIFALSILAFLCSQSLSTDRAIGSKNRVQDETASQRFQTLLAREQSFMAGVALVAQRLADSGDPKQERELFQMVADRWNEFGREALTIAEEFPDEPEALDALMHHFDGMLPFFPEADQAAKLLLERHVNDTAFITRAPRFVKGLRARVSPAVEKLLRGLSQSESSEEIKGCATYSLAYLLHRKANSATASRAVKELSIEPIHPVMTVEPFLAIAEWVEKADVEASRREAERLYSQVVDHYVKQRAFDSTLGQAARSGLYALRHLSIGSAAPDIVGQDSAGTNFKLSDYRGKVVMLFFSAQWCGPCKALYPKQRALVEKYKNRPFALIGVSGDDSPTVLKEARERGEINWRCFVGGGRNNPIVKQWHVDKWPTIIILDHEGVIRFRDPSALDERVIKHLVDWAQQQ